MADFIRHLLAQNRPQAFLARLDELQDQFYRQVAGRDNDVRIAGNYALLASAFEELAGYLGDVWPGAEQAKRAFVEQHVPTMLRATLEEVGEQKTSRVFLETLASLIQQGRVRIDGAPQTAQPGAVLIGRVASSPAKVADTPPAAGRVAPGPRESIYEIWTAAALGEVQQALRQRERPVIQITERALLQQLGDDGALLDGEGKPLRKDSEPTRQVKIEGHNRRAFRIRPAALMGGRA